MPAKKNDAAKWLKLSRAICAELRPKILAVSGTPKAVTTINEHGASGDETTYVDDLSERIFAKHFNAFMRTGERFSVLSEERGLISYGAPFPLVVVDPIDGSINCKRGLPFYAVSIGVYEGPTVGTGIFGYVMNLANGDEFRAAAGTGQSFLNNKSISFKPEKKRKPALLLVEMPQKQEIMQRAMPLLMLSDRTRAMGTLALAVTYTASGAVDMFLHLKPTRVIDYAGAKIILEEAGGLVTDENGISIDTDTVDLKRKKMLIASRGKALQDMAVKVLGKK